MKTVNITPAELFILQALDLYTNDQFNKFNVSGVTTNKIGEPLLISMEANGTIIQSELNTPIYATALIDLYTGATKLNDKNTAATVKMLFKKLFNLDIVKTKIKK